MTRHRGPNPVVRHGACPLSDDCRLPRATAGGAVRTLGASILLAVGLLVAIGEATGTLADEPSESLDRELLDALEGKSPQDSPLQIIPRLIDSTQAAASRLQEGQLDENTQQLQTQILADIDSLLEQATPPSQSPQDGAGAQSASQQQQQQQDSQTQKQQQDASQQNSQSEQDDEGDPNAASKESEERTARGEDIDAERQRRLGLSTAAWGHLPPKVREQMRSAFSEEYLPQYDALVRQYYEALARRRADER